MVEKTTFGSGRAGHGCDQSEREGDCVLEQVHRPGQCRANRKNTGPELYRRCDSARRSPRLGTGAGPREN